jgi:hypothetical protein
MNRLRSFALLLCLLLAATADAEEDHRYELAARVRGIFLTPTMLAPIAGTNSSLASLAMGTEFVVRRRTYDVVTSLDFSFIDVSDGNFLGAGRDPSQDTHYFQFGNFGQLTFISADVSIIGHTALGRWVELRYGAGVGLGGLAGNIKVINNGRQCNAANYRDGSQCYPHTPDQRVDVPLGRPDSEAKLVQTEKPGAIDLADDPHRHVSQSVPPVVPVINVVLGLRFKVARHFAFDIEAGFRDMMFVGASLRALF